MQFPLVNEYIVIDLGIRIQSLTHYAAPNAENLEFLLSGKAAEQKCFQKHLVSPLQIAPEAYMK